MSGNDCGAQSNLTYKAFHTGVSASTASGSTLMRASKRTSERNPASIYSDHMPSTDQLVFE